MQDGLQGNAMTEVALALAMGFFSILVLALVSMGAGSIGDAGKESPAVVLQPALLQGGATAPATTRPEDQIVIYHRGQLLDSRLAPLEMAQLAPERRVVLALAPEVPLAEIMRTYARLARSDLVVATLDARWLKRLENLEDPSDAGQQ